MSLEKNKKLVLQCTDEYYNEKEFDTLDKYFAKDFVWRGPTSTMNREEFLGASQFMTNAFPDLKIIIDDLTAEDDKVIKQWTMKATHQGEYAGVPATGNSIEVHGYATFRIKDNIIVEIWEVMDSLSLMQQIGAIPQPA